MKFYPAKHNSLFIWIFQHLNFIELSSRVKLNIIPSEIKSLHSFSQKAGLILVANHSDELDPRICMELSRRSGRRFTFMVNSEAYKEWFGIARWCLQYIGGFSVERGALDQEAISFAVDTVKKSHDILVIFPEGEIYNLNESVQPFKTGVAHIGLEAVQEMSKTSSDWTAYILPVAIKYHYQKNIRSTLKKRIIKMEKRLSIRSNVQRLRDELYLIMSKLGDSVTKTNNPTADIKEIDALVEKLQKARESVVSEIEKKYHAQNKARGDILSRAQKMIFFLREQMHKNKLLTKETQKQFKEDLQALRNTIQMAAWQPQYIELNPSEERLAETVMKLEKIVYNKKHSKPLGKREAFVRLLEPVDLSVWLPAYEKDPSTTSKEIVEALRTRIQESIWNIKDL